MANATEVRVTRRLQVTYDGNPNLDFDTAITENLAQFGFTPAGHSWDDETKRDTLFFEERKELPVDNIRKIILSQDNRIIATLVIHAIAKSDITIDVI